MARDLPALKVGSAGLHAVVGAAADARAAEVAAEQGVSLDGHVARQLTAELGAQYDLILVLEPAHRQEIAKRFPQLLGRTMLLDQWAGAQGIADPYRRSTEFHKVVHDRIAQAVAAWVPRLRR